VWNMKRGNAVTTLRPEGDKQSEVTCICLAPGDKELVAAGYADGYVRIWDISSRYVVFFPSRKSTIINVWVRVLVVSHYLSTNISHVIRLLIFTAHVLLN
jgi:WD40 repeat protein